MRSLQIMKISTAQYAQTLYDITEGKEKSRVALSVEKFTELLIKNRQIKLAGKIIKKFNDIYNQKHGIIEAEITSREKLNEELRNKLRNYVSNKYKAKGVVLNNKIDENIKGGIIIKVGDEILDASISGKLRNLKSLLRK